MSEQTSSAEELDRVVAAETLNDIASALREEGEMRVQVGNKEIELDPPETVSVELDWGPE